jgi:hypothetical protein
MVLQDEENSLSVITSSSQGSGERGKVSFCGRSDLAALEFLNRSGMACFRWAIFILFNDITQDQKDQLSCHCVAGEMAPVF